MAFCSFADGAAMFDSTPIENMFLIEHLADAPAAAMKVYLYARMLALHPELCGGIADMARALRMDEDVVYGAFAYWERLDLARRLSDNPPTYELLSVRALPSGGAQMDRALYAYRDFNNSLRALFGENAMMEDREFRKAGDWLNILGFEQDAVLRLVKYGIETSRSKSPKPASVFKRMDEKAEEWSSRGIRTLEEVERAIADEQGVSQTAREVLKRFGLRRQPTLDELDLVRRWTDQWHYTPEQVLEACQETVKARNPSFGYLDAILKGRLEERPGLREGLVEVLKELDPANSQPTPDQLKSYRALIEDGFAPETIRLAAVRCHRKRRSQFGDLEWMLSEWRKANVYTPEQAEAYLRRMDGYSAGMAEVYRRAGRDKRPSQADIDWYGRWREVFSPEVLEYAGECARAAGSDALQYLDVLLSAWQACGVRDLEDARRAREAHRAAQAEKARAERPDGAAKPANPALDYGQREYRDEDFDEGFFVDLSKYSKEGDGQ